MIKRMNKLTALLVAGTAVASIVPAVSANAATKLATQEGNLDQVQAFNNGKYIYEGYKDEAQDNGIYYSNGSKDVEIDDVDTFEFTTYGKNSVNFTDDDVLFNLETGKADEDTVSDKVDYLNTKFNSQIFKKVDRYKNNAFKIDTTNPINAGQFGDVWYNYTITAKDSDEVLYTGVVNSNASSYVDTSFTLNIVQYDENGKKVATIDDADDLAEARYTVKSSEVIFADADYIYNVLTIADSSSKETTYLQKISKAQGSTEDEAYLPKSVASYLIEDTEENAELLADLKDSNVEVRFVNGSLYTIEGSTGSLEVQKYDLVKTRDEDATIKDRINRVSYDEDYDFDTTKVTAFDIDVDGNVWVLYKGEIQKLVNGSLETVYTTDRTMDKISVYDADDIVVWNQDNEIYATVAGKDVSDDETEEDKNETIQTGWIKNSDGTWSYYKADGTKATGWLLDGSTWYYLNANGIMQTGWLNLSGTWYYLNGSGAMQTGWLNDNGTWYYLKSSGAMQTGWLNDNGTWYYLQANGAMKTGWLNDNGTWYYLQANGAMKTGWLEDTDGNWYYLQANGAMAKNTTIDGYRLGSNGAWIR